MCFCTFACACVFVYLCVCLSLVFLLKGYWVFCLPVILIIYMYIYINICEIFVYIRFAPLYSLSFICSMCTGMYKWVSYFCFPVFFSQGFFLSSFRTPVFTALHVVTCELLRGRPHSLLLPVVSHGSHAAMCDRRRLIHHTFYFTFDFL